jgi:hypothetical protein
VRERMRSLYLVPILLFACGDQDDTPTDHVLSQSTQLVQYSSCGDLEGDLKQMLIREVWAQIDRADQYYGFGGAEDTAGTGASGDNGGGRQEGVDYSGTNNQEQGVDEADGVKTDGYHIYALNGNRLHIFGTPNFGDLVPESVTQLEGHPIQMLLDKDAGRVAVFSIINVANLPDGHPLKQLVGWEDGQWYWRISTVTKITVLDVADRTAPHLVREVYFEGWYETARKVDTTVRFAAYSLIDRPEINNWWQVWNDTGHDKDDTKSIVASRIGKLRLDQLIPQMYVRTPDGRFVTNSLSTQQCQSFYRPSDSHARGIASIISFDLLGDNLFWDADHVVANWPTFYESLDKLVIAEPAHDYWWYWWFQDDPEQLNVHVFDASKPGTSSYLGSGRVNGYLWNPFSIDEQDGQVRLATTTGGWWHYGKQAPDPLSNHVWVLEQNGAHFDIVGHVGDIAVGERLMTSRFLGNQAYLVTYKSVDPLFTLDLTNPKAPALVGELKVPGFSTYLHPMGTSGLLSIGVDSSGWWHTNISMFDVSNFAAPQLETNLPIDATQGWSWSEALWDHKAFQYWEPKGLLAIPESNYRYDGTTYKYLSKLEVIDVDPTSGTLGLRGTIDHTPYYMEDPRYWINTDIRRSIFMGDYLYAISDKAITVHRTADLAQVTDARLPGYVDGDWWWWW